MENLPVKLSEVLEACTNGFFHEGLRVLYQSPYRDNVPWDRFPVWARPDLNTEGCHEG
jgi:hypothetical protein